MYEIYIVRYCQNSSEFFYTGARFFRDAPIVEYYYPEAAQSDGMDWQTLNMVFLKNSNGSWILTAIMNGRWTVREPELEEERPGLSSCFQLKPSLLVRIKGFIV